MSRDALHNQITLIMDLFYSEHDPVKRLTLIKEIGDRLTKELQKLRRETAYEAKFKMTWVELSEATGMDRRNLESIVRQFFRENPDKPKHPWSHSQNA